MAVFRIEKTRDYTVMSNHHLRDKSLSLKAKGLLSLMLSLPEKWDYIVLASGLEPVGFWKLFFVGIGQGIMMWAGALPCVLLVVLLNRSYIISVIITFFYTAVNYIFGTNDYFIMQPFGFNAGTLLPGPLTFRWFFQYLDTSSSSAQMTELMERISPYFVTTPQAFLVVILESAVFLTLIALVYKRQSC